jgi:hypothetical protein
MFPWLFPSIATLGLSDRSYEFSASVIALRKWTYRCPYCWVSLHQRSLLDSGAAGGGAVTYCYRSLSCDGHSLVLCGCPCFLVARKISVWLECTSAEQSAGCFDPMGMSPSPFSKPGALYALAVPDSFSLRRRFYLRSIVSCVLGLLGSICSCIAFMDSVLSSGRRLRSLFAHGHCAVRASPSTFGYALLVERAVQACLLRGVSDWNPARLQSAHFFCLVSEPFGC